VRSKTQAIQRWLRGYDRGEFDQLLNEMGRIRTEIRHYRTAISFNRAMLIRKVVSLLNVGIHCSKSLIKKLGAAIAIKNGTPWGNLTNSWAARILADAKKQSTGRPLFGELSEEGTAAFIQADVVNMKDLSAEWNGAHPDARLTHCTYEGMSEEAIKGCVRSTDFSGSVGYREMIAASRSPKDTVPGHCFIRSHMDDNSVRFLDPAQYWDCGIKEITVELGSSQIQVASMPPSLIEELRECLHKLYGGREEGVGMSAAWLDNSQRKLPGGRMACLMVKEMDGETVVSYASCRADRQGANGSAFETIGKLSSKFGNWFKLNFPERWNEIRGNNTKEGWKFPPHFNHPDLISPRMFVTDRLANEAHVDYNDVGPCVVFWIKDSPMDNDTDWQFVFENVRTGEGNGKRDSLTVQLHDGLVIIFDGTKVRHCTSVPDASSPRKFGVYHGTSKIK